MSFAKASISRRTRWEDRRRFACRRSIYATWQADLDTIGTSALRIACVQIGSHVCGVATIEEGMMTTPEDTWVSAIAAKQRNAQD
jgi:hypothetical protein